jgi:EmrB/QacA subfamily drug resistance transporter
VANHQKTTVQHPAWTLALTAVGAFMVALDALVVVTALPAIHYDVGGDISSLQWIVNAYLLAFAAGIITAAALGDRIGRRRLFAIGLSIFAAASDGCALAPTAPLLITARALQGMGAAIVTPLSLSLLATAFRTERRGMVIGIWGGIAGLAVASGPLVGGAVTKGLNWHWIFWVNVPIGLLAAVLSAVLLQESRGPDARLDLPGAALVSGSGLGLLWGLVRGNAAGWGSPEVVISLGLGLLLLPIFVAWERRARAPMLPLRLFGIRTFAAANAVGFLMFATILSAAFFMSQYFQFVLGYSPFDTGLRFLPWTATPAVIAPIAGKLADRHGPRPLMFLGLGLQEIGLGSIAVLATSTVGYETLVLPLIVAGVGISMAVPTTPMAALGAVPREDVGKASGVMNTMQRFGGPFGVAVASAAFAADGQLGTSAGFMAGFHPALAVSAGLSVMGAIFAIGIARHHAQASSIRAAGRTNQGFQGRGANDLREGPPSDRAPAEED